MQTLSTDTARFVYCEDALEWLKNKTPPAGSSLVASLPDISEFSSKSVSQWKHWFIEAASLVLSRTPDDGVTVFYQSDIKIDGEWIDKGFLCHKAAEAAGRALLWHKIACRSKPGVVTSGRPAYSHILCFSAAKRPEVRDLAPDVLP